MKTKISKFLVLGGFLGPVLFTAVLFFCASLRPGYNHLHDFISELGATGTANATLMNYMGFFTTGIFILLFATAMWASQRKPRLFRIGFGLIALFGLGILLSGLFSCDKGCPDFGSQESNVHQTIAPITFVSAVLGVFLTGISFRKIPYLRTLWKYSIFSAVVAFIFLLILIDSLETRMFTGLWQRILLLVLLLWTALIAIRKITKKPNEQRFVP